MATAADCYDHGSAVDMSQLEHIDAIERRLWEAADTLRSNSKYASNQYFLPVMGLVFLRHAYSRYMAVSDNITAGLPKRGGKTRALTKEDYSQRSAIFLRPEARFNHLVALPDGEDRAAAILTAMESIEADYESLRVDELDADKVKTDPRLPFGLPVVNNRRKVGNGNYVWISYFYSYLNETGRARPEGHRDKVLMIDARGIYRKVTRKICDFSPEQQQNLLAIVRLYRGESARFLEIAFEYLRRAVEEGRLVHRVGERRRRDRPAVLAAKIRKNFEKLGI